MKDFLALIIFITAIGFGVCLFNESQMAGKFGGTLLLSYITYLSITAYERKHNNGD
jgi:hypothetical protein